MYQSKIKQKGKKHDKIVFIAKTKLNSIEVPIYKTLIDLYISYDELVLVNNVLKEYDDLRNNPNNRLICFIYQKKY